MKRWESLVESVEENSAAEELFREIVGRCPSGLNFSVPGSFGTDYYRLVPGGENGYSLLKRTYEMGGRESSWSVVVWSSEVKKVYEFLTQEA